jgi:uncharacterized protein (TIGR03000 family)
MTHTMFRILAPLGVVLIFGHPADAQRIIRSSGPARTTNGPDCVFPEYPYLLPAPAEPLPWDAPDSWTPAPPANASTARSSRVPAWTLGPTRQSDLRARLALEVPTNAKVWLAGKPVDTTVRPVVLESRVLGRGQTFTFDVRVTWPDGNKMEERTRTVTVDAGHRMSVTYFGGR